MMRAVDCWVVQWAVKVGKNNQVVPQGANLVLSQTGLQGVIESMEHHGRDMIPDVNEVVLLEIKRMVVALLPPDLDLTCCEKEAPGSGVLALVPPLEPPTVQ
jgi:hypothetical protein